jgi:DNA-binding MarR family transcriptional regulator
MKIALDAYVLDVLMRDLAGHDHKPSAFLVYLALWWKQARGHDMYLSLRDLADATGLSKSAVQGALRLLVRRQLVRADRYTPTSVPQYTLLRPWLR